MTKLIFETSFAMNGEKKEKKRNRILAFLDYFDFYKRMAYNFHYYTITDLSNFVLRIAMIHAAERLTHVYSSVKRIRDKYLFGSDVDS
ncbi:Hypothetical predicted protein [Octopus vulgaris]|uniref:Uncharacterized protein n=1 Tax=Octopus vulgaris TaxID=6645 RepID=A0AA36BTC5_OCTVU|nr:Hypothetical predicted protein [Octopus vulgaris]